MTTRQAKHGVKTALMSKYGFSPKLKDIDIMNVKHVDSFNGLNSYDVFADINGKGYAIDVITIYNGMEIVKESKVVTKFLMRG